MHNQKHMKHMQECIDKCNDCRDECEQTLFRHCLEMGGEHVEQRHVQLMADCIEICQTAAKFMLRGSEMHQDICVVCADICEVCAESCEEIGGKEMERCADVCRECAEVCREMSSMPMKGKGRSTSQRQGIMA